MANPVKYPSRECKHDIKDSEGNVFTNIKEECPEEETLRELRICRTTTTYRKPKHVVQNEKIDHKIPITVTTIMMKIMMK